MDSEIEKIIDEKYENVVQFNVVNTTNQNLYLNLFNTANLSPVTTNPTISNPANTSLGTFSTPFGAYKTAFNTSNGDIFVGQSASNLLYVYDSNYNYITTITLGFPFINTSRDLFYNSINNTLYVIPLTSTTIKIIDCSNYTIIASVVSPISNWVSGVFCSAENSLYISTNIGFVVCLDSSLNFTTIPTSPQPYFIVYDNLQNRVYFGDNVTNTMEYIDCATNTFVNIAVPFPSFAPMPSFGASYCPLNGEIFSPQAGTNSIDIFDTNTNTFLLSTSFSEVSNTSTLAFDSNQNLMYLSYVNTSVIYFNPLNNLELGLITTISTFIVLEFNPYNNQLLVGDFSGSTNLQLYTTANVYSSNYYITGASNYNSFVNNLNNEPISIQLIRLLVQNQNQLNNEVQLTKIDSNGNQVFMPNFPINQVSAYQQQGNIGEINVDNIIFDGRTYINQYQLNPYETISFEIYYKQLDLTSTNMSYPIMFKNKVSLKEYIDDNYDDFIEF